MYNEGMRGEGSFLVRYDILQNKVFFNKFFVKCKIFIYNSWFNLKQPLSPHPLIKGSVL
jgi:hypothetical protein